jgi:hypothetical protein
VVIGRTDEGREVEHVGMAEKPLHRHVQAEHRRRRVLLSAPRPDPDRRVADRGLTDCKTTVDPRQQRRTEGVTAVAPVPRSPRRWRRSRWFTRHG